MRIVAGLAKGRRLAPPAAGTRPTSDRAREAMFNSLAASMELDGARVLDLFAGTGAVGLEALSRGARTAVLVERDRDALAVLRRNVATVGLPGAVVIGRAVEGVLAEPPREPFEAPFDAPFDLVFADPPYALPDDAVATLLTRLVDGGRLAADALVVLERPARSTPGAWAASSLTPVAEKRYGDSLLWYGRAR